MCICFCSGYALGFLNLEEDVANVDGKVTRNQVCNKLALYLRGEDESFAFLANVTDVLCVYMSRSFSYETEMKSISRAFKWPKFSEGSVLKVLSHLEL